MDVRKELISRFSIIYWVFIALSILSLFILISIRFFQRNKYKNLQTSVYIGKISAQRGNIYDCKGKLLATNIYKYDLRFDPLTQWLTDERFNKYIDSVCNGLSPILGNSPQYYKNLFTKARQKSIRGILFAKNVSYWQLLQIKKLPLFNKGRYKSGLIAEKKHERKLLNNNLARRTIGIVNNENQFFGIEYMANGFLSGSEGYAKFHKLGKGWSEIINIIQQPDNGANVYTTIDLRLQDLVEKSLKKRLKELNAESGVAILMEVKTGKIRAVANLSKVKDNYFETKNIAATELYEPGSVMKLASFIADFEENPKLTLDTKVNTTGGIWHISRDFSIKDYNYIPGKKGGFGIIPLQRVFELSSNTGTAKTAYEIFKDKAEDFVNLYSSFYFDKKLNLGFTNEVSPYFSKPGSKMWSGVSIAQMAIGYEINVTPYHVITLYNAIANDGKMVKPIFIEKVEKNGKIIKKQKPIILNSSICSNKTLKYCQTMLKGVVNNGTGKHYVKSDLVEIAGKTGTAQINQSGGYTSDTTKYNATFVGYFPADNPKYTCLVLISKPKKDKSGGKAAGVVVKDIVEKIYTFDYDLHKEEFVVNKMPKKYKTPFISTGFSHTTYPLIHKIGFPYKASAKKLVKASVQNDTISFIPIKIKNNKMPNVVNMNIRDAMYILGNMGLKANIKGYGIVKKQSISPNSTIKKGQTVTLYLN